MPPATTVTPASQLQGLGVSPGLAVGPVRHMVGSIPTPEDAVIPTADRGVEGSRAAAALEAVAADLEERGRRAGGEAETVLEAEAMMARDPDLAEAVRSAIDAGRSAPRAVVDAFNTYRELSASAGAYIAGRVADLDDVRDRVVATLQGVPMPGIPAADTPFVLVAHDLAPADTASLPVGLVLGLLTEEGGPTSHTAILARATGVPAVVACPGALDIADGTVVILDGTTGGVRVDPGESEMAAAHAESARRLQTLALPAAGPGTTADGHRVALMANVGSPTDLEAAVREGAEGIGLYRTEFLYMGRHEEPSEDEQASAYAAALAAFPDERVVVRVLDAGSDKPLPFLAPPGAEPNPALGVRGLRLLRHHPDVLGVQLRALARAAKGGGRLAVMAPMVTDGEEAAWFLRACRDAGLTGPVGVMVEVPAAALRASTIIAEVDFLSLGTNDLTQYALAADRQLGALRHLQDPWHPAVLQLVAIVAAAAQAVGRGCGVCGEAAADPALACVLVGLGVTSLSMVPPSLVGVRAALGSHSLEQCRHAAAVAREAGSATDARALARAALPHLAPEA
jgi:phosphotransferase system enzyme I (PtsI)